MALNPKFVTAPSLQQYFVDKDSGEPLSGGTVEYFSDENRTVCKAVFQLQGNQANYTYEPLPNPVNLSAVGTIQDNNGNDVIPYYFPFREDNTDTPELYFIVVKNSLGVPQFTRQAWPNPDQGEAFDELDTAINYIPNGQLLAHTDLEDNVLVGGENTIAQGGISIVLPESPASVNELEFIAASNTGNAPGNPRYTALFTSINPSALDNIKAIRVKFRDVNKFSSDLDPQYTFGFFASSNVEIPFSLDIFKFYGTNGSPFDKDSVATGTIDAFPRFYSFTFRFGENIGKEVDIVNNDDFISIEIDLAKTIGFELEFSDFVLVLGAVPLEAFPTQTNADMLTRGVAGWVDTPNPTGFDLYLPMILTREGMQFDDSGIGKILADVGDILLPDDPNAIHNELPCDGATYISADFSTLGIPFARLRDRLIEKSSIIGLPLFGTGDDFATSLPVEVDRIMLSVNDFGTPVAAAANGASATPFLFVTSIEYAGSAVGSASLDYIASWDGVNQFVARATNFLDPFAPLSAGTSPFSFEIFNTATGLYAEQDRAGFRVVTTSGATLANPGGAALFWDFSNATTTHRVYYVITDETPPADPGVLIEIKITASYSANDVALVTSHAVNAYQVSEIEIAAVPSAGNYFTFQTNPSLLRSFFVWYSFAITDIEPAAVGTAIRVDLLATDTEVEVLSKTNAAINGTEFAVPDLRGMFLRGADFAGEFDLDNTTRFGFGSVGGANYGTFEFQQFLNHIHAATSSVTSRVSAGGGIFLTLDTSLTVGTANIDDTVTATTSVFESGGSETRPVNAYVNWVMKY